MASHDIRPLDSDASGHQVVDHGSAHPGLHRGLVNDVLSEDRKAKLAAMKKLSRMLADANPPMDLVLESGVVPHLVKLLAFDDPQLQLNSAWVLNNIASHRSQDTKAIIDAGAVPELIKLLESSSLEIREEALWALGNIAGDSPQAREHVIQSELLSTLTKLLLGGQRVTVLRKVAWMLANLGLESEEETYNKLSSALPILAHLIESPDDETVADTCWALARLVYDSEDRMQTAIDLGICPRAIELLHNRPLSVQAAALRLVGNIATSYNHTDTLIRLGAISTLLPLFSSPVSNIRRNACWAMSNIAAGPPRHIHAIIDADVIPSLMDILKNDELPVKREACWVILNASEEFSMLHIDYLVSQGCLDVLCGMLELDDRSIIGVVLEGISNILTAGRMFAGVGDHLVLWSYLTRVKGSGCLTALHRLQYHDDASVRRKSINLLADFLFDDESQGDLL